jgi:hypothetical protein
MATIGGIAAIDEIADAVLPRILIERLLLSRMRFGK